MPLGSVTSMIVVTVAHRSIKIVNKLLRLRIVGFVTLLSSDRITNCYQVPSRHHVEVRVLPACCIDKSYSFKECAVQFCFERFPTRVSRERR